MLTIRQNQLQSLATEVLIHQLKLKMADNFPNQYQTLSAKNAYVFIKYGVLKAQSYGLQTQAELSTYVALTFTFGRDFDTNPEMPWSKEILCSKLTPSQKIQSLLNKIGEFEDKGWELYPQPDTSQF